jgi:hypothetical protein
MTALPAPDPVQTRKPWRKRLAMLPAIGMLGVVLLAASIPAFAVYQTWATQRGVRIAWDIVGPPCPTVAEPAKASFGRLGAKVFTYEGVRFERRFGHASCVAPLEKGFMNGEFYRVCQFSGPETVRVTNGSETLAFKPGVGRTATVKVQKGRVTCVVAGWFRP